MAVLLQKQKDSKRLVTIAYQDIIKWKLFDRFQFTMVNKKVDQLRQFRQRYNKMENCLAYTKNNHRKDRLRTIGTTDTYDLNANDTLFNKENKQRNGSALNTLSKTTIKQHILKKTTKSHNKSLNSNYVHSQVRETTSKVKGKRMMSIHYDEGFRLKTDYSERGRKDGFKRIVSELKKKLVYPTEDSYRFESFKILKTIHKSSQQQFYTAKMGGRLDKKYTLIKTNDNHARQYQREGQLFNEISRELAKKESQHFLRIENVYRQKKHWIVVMDNYLSTDWQSDRFYLFLNQFKNSPLTLLSFMQQMAEALLILSKTGRAYSRLSIGSVYFPISKGELKTQGVIKLGGLYNSIFMRRKQELLKMPICYQTPPQILNFILFEEGEVFDRDYLEHIAEVKQGWQVDVWSLGIVILQLLNGGPLAGEGSDCSKLIELQRQLLIRYSYLLQRLSQRVLLCLSNMLSFNPGSRPHPLQILRVLRQDRAI